MASSIQISKIEDTLNCAICQDVLQDPRNLECGHTFCTKCLDKWHKNQGGQLTRIVCPNCKRATPLPQKSVVSLPRAYALRGVVDKVGELMRQTSIGTQCQLCTDPTVIGEANIFCSACDKVFCDVCEKRHRSCFSAHPIVQLCEDTQKFLSCSIHSQEMLKHFCTTCSTLICTLCALDGGSGATHQNHSILPLGDTPTYCQEQLKRSGSLMKQELRKKKALLSEARSAVENINIEAKSVTDSIHYVADDLIAMVQQWEEETLLRLEIDRKDCVSHWEQIVLKMEGEATGIHQDMEKIHGVETDQMKSPSVKDYVTLLRRVKKQREESKSLASQISGPVIKRTSAPDVTGEIKAILAKHSSFKIDPCTRKINSRDNYENVVITRKPRTIWTLADYGSGEKQLRSPVGVSFTKTNDILVCEVENHRLSLYSCVQDSKSKDVLFLRKFQVSGLVPKDVVSDEEGRLFVADSKTNSIAVLDRLGHQITSWGEELFLNPRCLALMSNNRIAIGDKGKNEVMVCKRDGISLHTLGSKGDAADNFQCIVSIATDSRDRIIVADRELNTIKIFDEEGKFLFKILPMGEDGYCKPRYSIELAGITTDKNDNIYVTVHGSHQLIKYSPDGHPTPPYPMLSSDNGLRFPCGVAIGQEGYVAIVESSPSLKHAAIRVFKL